LRAISIGPLAGISGRAADIRHNWNVFRRSGRFDAELQPFGRYRQGFGKGYETRKFG